MPCRTACPQGQCLFESEQDVGWDQRRFAAPAHQQFSMFHDGRLALEASWSHPTLKKAMALACPDDIVERLGYDDGHHAD